MHNKLKFYLNLDPLREFPDFVAGRTWGRAGAYRQVEQEEGGQGMGQGAHMVRRLDFTKLGLC